MIIPSFNWNKIMSQHKNTNSSKSEADDIIKLLKADHAKVKDLFDEFEELKDKSNNTSKKEKIVKQICEELTLHALAEESIVYPTARETIDDDDLMDEADVEHAGAKELISQLQSMSAEDSHYDAKVTVLREYIEHHVKEEEKNMFPKLTKSEIDRSEMAKEVIHFKEDHKDSRNKASSKKT
ncbi:Hemerythrin HHE cation binding domain-containing protein [Nitrosomonas ureae]|uniref:Hemerythrin HHE cation binding domain-containing protein n=2 Tax=Nitrosomonas ureae TaxID=44577 RepID=A0A1H2H3Y5_9PROT|nr:Hemerythrin HHE cation binding domain-containing protein [Nitrosomonas ureae]